ncbi:hypothetical protein [Streptomyces bullii]|uniref:Uncharacterized protein n=1 Tax=Streptomyces bullii TaxID=349910 RepID=A0ABW0UVB8_9ACTN
MSAGVSTASGKAEMVEAVLRFMPDWVQITVLALVVLAVLVSWGLKLKRRIAYRRAVRAGRPVHAAAQCGQGRGADHLGAYAPQQGSGADHLGAYAPQAQQGSGADHLGAPQGSGAGHLGAYAQQPQRQPSGADFLGAYAPQQRQGPA